MRGNIVDLASFSEERMFTAIAEGLPLIAQSAEKFDEVASRLFDSADYRGSEILKGLAKEEAAKALILLDSVRCPRESKRRAKTLEYFYSHTAKRIYSMACSLTGVLSFRELEELVQTERQPYYLDGPRQVDWIFPNAINASREGSMYVDYLQDLTDSTGDYSWNCPADSEFGFGRYLQPESVRLCRIFCDAGLDTAEGLGILALIWRGFEPKSDTGRDELKSLIAETLHQLENVGLRNIEESHSPFIFSSWSFPLWPLELDQIQRSTELLNHLREVRSTAIERIEEIEAKREPALTVERTKVEALSKTYFDWQRAIEELEAVGETTTDEGLKIRSLSDFGRHHELPSYKKLQQIYDTLSRAERTDLVALAWYSRFTVASWPEFCH